MKKEDKNYIKNKLENEGFDYAFVHYSSFSDIKDEEFHRLREAYIEAHKALEDYLNKK